MNQRMPIVWSIAGVDSGGGAGLSADQRIADAMQVYLCPVVAALTAQNSLAVTQIQEVGVDFLEQQLLALEIDFFPQAIKTGLLASVEQLACVAHWIDRLRLRAPVALVVDPVFKASTGASFANQALIAAYCEYLLPRATLITPNQQEAWCLLNATKLLRSALPAPFDIPAQASALRALGCAAVCITGGDVAAATTSASSTEATQSSIEQQVPDDEFVQNLALDWIDTPQAQAWMALPRSHTQHTHGTGCTFATAASAAMAKGFVTADALVLAKMATAHAIGMGQALGQGPGAVRAGANFIVDPTVLPRLSWGPKPKFLEAQSRVSKHAIAPLGLYAIVESIERLEQVLAAGINCVQLRIKATEPLNDMQNQGLAHAIEQAVKLTRAARATLFINDHFELALQAKAFGVHMGQEDLLALSDDQRHALGQQVALGISTHSLWEFCRALSLNPLYVACGPIWATTTKLMPWHEQGIPNLAWWCAMAPCPVVAIGAILTPVQVEQVAQARAAGIGLVRGLGSDPKESVADLVQALQQGRALPAVKVHWPRPSLTPTWAQ